MREIRFRVWDNVHKEWLIYKEWHVGWQCPLDKPAKAIRLHMYVSKDGLAFNELQFCIDSPNFDVVEFTGLQDCKGKDIFESDMLKWNNSETVYPITVDDFHGYRFMWHKDTLTKAHAENGEIIGNIYE